MHSFRFSPRWSACFEFHFYFISHFPSRTKLLRNEMSYYAVKVGRTPGIYRTWDECSNQVKGYANCRYKKFKTEAEARNFVNPNSHLNPQTITNVEHDSRVSTSILHLGNPAPIPTISNVEHDSRGSTSILHLGNPAPMPRLEIPRSASRKRSYYAVHRGAQPGVYNTWTECEQQIKGISRPSYRKFETEEEALEYVRTGGIKKLKRAEARDIPINQNFQNDSDDTVHTINDVRADPEEFVTVFTDGANSRNGKIDAAAGIGVYWGPNHPLNTSMRLPGRQTNNRAEIYAATHALRQAKSAGARNIKLYTDSQFLIHGITDWIHKWKKNNWKLANGQNVKNKDDFIELDKAQADLNVEYIYIKAHDNNPGNVEADKLAVEGACKDLNDTFISLI